MNLYKIILLVLFTTKLYCQIPGPTTNWYFGTNAGITFNSGAPIALTNGSLATTEGVATISDNSGNLLFYTDGVTVYNRLHNVMTNGTGLFGHISSTQSAIIIQKPGSTNTYYIFTTPNDATLNGVCYSIVDMNLSAGLGAVTIKNTFLYAPSCEKICAIRHCNNIDIWVVTHDWNSNIFRTWLVSSLGVGTTQTWSAAGIVVNGATQGSYGQLKSSSDGKKLAACHYGFAGGLNRLQIYDFNNSTGIVTNAVTIATDIGLYGCEFSPDNRVLYAATNGGLLLQFNLCSTPISRYVVSNNGPFIGSLQIGPDRKIYVARNQTSLSVINNPNTVGIGCGYSDLTISLSGRAGRMGLPNFASYYSTPQLIIPNPIINCTTALFSVPINTINCSNPSTYTYLWNFGDGTTSILSNPTHTYLSTGTYIVTLQIIGTCSTITINKTIIITNGIITSVFTN
jgi:PKD repeat protein